MARKKAEVQLMRDIDSQEEWEDVMVKEGLWVVDVYQEWSGPCNAMVGNFRRIKNELGDDLLHFAQAKADNVEFLEKYRGSCEPCFLFFGGGSLVSYVHGANAPLILRTLTEQLAQEHKVVDGNAERKEVKDPFVASRDMEVMPDDEEEEEDLEEGFTVAIIKPNVVQEGKTAEILAEMKAQGIKILKQEERQLTEDEAREFYSHLRDEEYFDDLVKFMSSGPSHVLVLTRGQSDDSIIKDWRDMLGPPAVEDAKEYTPESLRARFGDAGLMNGVHGSDSKETAARELGFFFPQMEKPKMPKKPRELQRTLALIRPDAFALKKDEILASIQDAGFQIALSKEVTLNKEQAEEFYKEHEGQPYFEELVNRMSSGPLLALGLAREDAVSGWRDMLGPADLEEAKEQAPDSLRAQFSVEDNPLNQLHGSDSPETAKTELNYFFPMQQTVAMIKPDAIGTKDAIIEKIHEAGFRIAARKEDTITQDIAEAFYEEHKDKDYYNDLVQHMVSGPTMFMVLSREDAVDGWRQVIGPTDPEKAKEEAPDTLRAQFGQSVLQNAVHGSSNPEDAQKRITAIFGQMEFASDGNVKDAPGEQEPQQSQDAAAVVGSGGTEAADVAPEYRQEAEQEKPKEEAAPAGSRPASAAAAEPAAQAGSRPASAAKAGSRPTSAAKPGSRPASAAKPGSRPASGAKEASRPASAAKAGSRPASAAKPGSRPASGAKEASRPASAAKAGSRPASAAQEEKPDGAAETEAAPAEDKPAEEAAA